MSGARTKGTSCLCTKLQDPEVEHIITNFSQDLTCECVKPGKNAKIQRTKSPESPKHQNEPEPVRLTLKQLNKCNLAAIPSDGDAGFMLMPVCDVSALLEEILEGTGYNKITVHDINFESVSKSVWMWAMSVSIHEETAELKNELFLDCASFGKEWFVAKL